MYIISSRCLSYIPERIFYTSKYKDIGKNEILKTLVGDYYKVIQETKFNDPDGSYYEFDLKKLNFFQKWIYILTKDMI